LGDAQRGAYVCLFFAFFSSYPESCLNLCVFAALREILLQLRLGRAVIFCGSLMNSALFFARASTLDFHRDSIV
jgi:hypothetical protein